MNDFFKKMGIELHDIWVAFALLSRLPIPVDHARAGQRGANAAWAYPLVGITIGLVAGLVGVVLQKIGAPRGVSIVAALITMISLAGGMHEDGLADTADSLGGNTKERRLEIMKDSHIGVFGTLALILIILARYSSISAISGWYLVLVLAAVGGISRAVMVVMMYLLPFARPDGLSATTGKPDQLTTIAACVVAAVIGVLLAGILGGLVAIIGAILVTVPVYFYAKKRIGGQTGDILGTAQQFADIGALTCLAAVL